jgi:hypothetical protein
MKITQTKSLFHVLLFTLGALLCVAEKSASRQQHDGASPTSAVPGIHLETTYGKLPLSFERSHGPAGEGIDFVARSPGYAIALSASTAAFRFRDADVGGAETDLRMTLVGADVCSISEPMEPLPGTVNYFIGSDPAKWRAGLPTFARVRYAAVYRGIDLEYYGNQRQLEYDFRVAPGADWHQVLLEFAGAHSVTTETETGDLLIAVGPKIVRLRRPFVSQEVNGQRREVASSYTLHDGNKVGFAIAKYDPELALLIDPVLAYSTYLGGTGADIGRAIAVDASGNAYIAGETASTDFPTTSGAFDTTYNGSTIAFVSKLNPSGTALVYSTYLGGSINSGTGKPSNTLDRARGIAVDASGNAYITGETFSIDFPTTPGAFDTTQNSPGGFDAFVTKLSPDGTALIYSTYLGGTDSDIGFGIAIDSSGNTYVTCQAGASFPTTPGAYDTTYGGGFDATATKLNSTGTALIYSTYLGGGGFDQGIAIAVDGSGNAYITGQADGASFPTTPGAFDTTANGGRDPFVTKVNTTGTDIIYSTFLGGTSFDRGEAIVVDSSGNAYVAGQTDSTDFPTTPGAFDTTANGGRDGFVTKLNASGTALVYSTYMGGSTAGFEKANSIAVDSAGNVYVAGETPSADFPTTPDAIDTTHNGGSDVFFTKISPAGTALVYSTFFGGGSTDQGLGIALDSSGSVFVTGVTGSSDMPTTAGAFDTSYNGATDAFVLKIAQSSAPSPTPTASPQSTATATATATATPTPTPTATPVVARSQLLNIATRMQVQTDPNQLIGGFIITGSESKKVIILATGPSLSAFGIPGVLDDPVLELYRGSTLVARNDNWKVPAQTDIEATGLQPAHDLESALVQTLEPGSYTAIVRGTNGTGVGTVQLYDLAPNSDSKLANISSRGFVGASDDRIMIAGFIVGGDSDSQARVVVRALGPSLAAFGIAEILADPFLELKNANGTTLRGNDDWQQAQEAAEISARGLAPSDGRESVLAISLPNGGYTAIVRGRNAGTGVGVVEVYRVE